MNFDQFIATLSDEQKQALMQSLMQPAQEEQKPKRKPRTKTSKPAEKTKTKEDFITTSIKTKGAKEPVKFKRNEWYDTGENEKPEEELRTPKYTPKARDREKSKKVEVECHVCGKTFYEDPRYIYGEFLRCSRCASRR